MKNKLHLILLGMAFGTINAHAQTIQFEQTDYQRIGVYDSWQHSPFRTNKLTGNVQIVSNPDTKVDELLNIAPNTSKKVLAFQRSRYGSNTFGARIDLKNPIKLSPTTQYVHVMIHKPVAGRVMLIGLGKRAERTKQSKDTEQFWVLSTNKVEPNKWVDAVFPIKGASGAEVYSLVVVPDNESTHALTNDFAVYIDNIVVNNESKTSTQREPYPINIDTKSKYNRTDRGLKGIKLNDKRIAVANNITKQTPVYRQINEQQFTAKPGDKLTPAFDYTGTWMHGYVYLDYGKDGKFSTNLQQDGKPATGSDVVAYSFYSQNTNSDESGFNSNGESISGGNRNVVNPPAFTLPTDIKTGLYRMRYKVDWNYIDAGGNPGPNNNIVNNGGAIVDVILNVHPDQVNITNAQRNGDVLDTEGNVLKKTIPFGKAYTIKMRPENGFTYKGIRIRHGYNLQGDSLIHGVPQYRDIIIKKSRFANDDTYTIPAELVDGDISIEGLFISTTSPEANDYYAIDFEKDCPNKHQSRRLKAVAINGQQVEVRDTKLTYHNLTNVNFSVKAGQTIKPAITYDGNWMQTYIYLDKNQNGYFEWSKPQANGKLTDDNELVSVSAANCENGKFGSDGTQLNNLNRIEPVAFNLPQTLKTGHYMLRFKVDWDNLSPEGNTSTANHIANNGGAVVDVRMFVHHGEKGKITYHPSNNGNVLFLNGKPLHNAEIAYGKEFTLLVKPNKGYKLSQLKIKHGNLTAKTPTIKGVLQYTEDVYTAQQVKGGLLTINPNMVDGDIDLTPVFVATTADDEDENEYQLVFNDEFEQENGSVPNPNYWKTSVRYPGPAWSRFIANNPKVAYIQDGCLVLKCIKNTEKNKDNVDMISGAIETKDLFSFTYGRVDVRMKTTLHTGNFPAAWMMPQPPCEGWPKAGEIDIFEAIDNSNTAYHTVHSNWTYTLKHKLNPKSFFSEKMQVEQWHVYSVVWTKDKITWLVDGKEMGSYAKSTTDSQLKQGQWPFDKPFYLILNQSVGNGSWAKNPDTNFTYQSEVDYIRVFQPKKITGIKQVPLSRLAVSNDAYYDLQGRKLLHPTQKGIYIHQGKKVVIK